LLARIGTSDPVEERFTIKQLAESFSFSKNNGRAPARFDDAELRRELNLPKSCMKWDFMIRSRDRLDVLGNWKAANISGSQSA